MVHMNRGEDARVNGIMHVTGAAVARHAGIRDAGCGAEAYDRSTIDDDGGEIPLSRRHIDARDADIGAC